MATKEIINLKRNELIYFHSWLIQKALTYNIQNSRTKVNGKICPAYNGWKILTINKIKNQKVYTG